MRLKNLLFFISTLCILLYTLTSSEGRGQSLLESNPADANDSKTLFTNPAIMSFQDPQIILGIKAFHLGIIENNTYGLKCSLLGLTLPNIGGTNIGVGLTGLYYDTPIYDEGHFGLEISKTFFSNTSVGIKLGFISHSYAQDKFDLVDENDPVFANSTSKTVMSVGLGCLYYPTHRLSLGVAVDHLNQPNLSLVGDSIKQPLIANLGAKYNLGFIRPCLGITLFRNESTPNFYLESYTSDWGLVRFGYFSNSLKVEGLLCIIGGMSLNYVYEYPLSDLSGVTGGTHLISFVYNFNKGMDTIGYLSVADFSKRLTETEAAGLLIDSEVDTLDVIKNNITQTIGSNITNDQIASLPAAVLVGLDSTNYIDPKPLDVKPLDIIYQNIPSEQEYSLKNQETLNRFSQLLSSNKNVTLNIVSDSSSVARALKIQKLIASDANISSDRIKIVAPTISSQFESIKQTDKFGPNQVPRHTTFLTLSADSNRFMVYAKGISREVKNWQLVIRNHDGMVIKTLSGQGYLPSEIPWNWREDVTAFSGPGRYYYQLQWQDIRNRRRQSNVWSFIVREIHRRISVKVLKDLATSVEADQVYLYLNK